MFRLLLFFLAVFALGAGCRCDPFDIARFVCATQADCAEGFECLDLGAGLECVRAGTSNAGEVDAGEVDAGEVDAGEVDAGVVDAGVDAGVPDGGPVAVALRFASGSQTVLAGACSQVMVVETVNAVGAATPVSSTTTVTLTANPTSLSFFTSSSCSTTAVTSVTIAANASSVTFYASGSPARAYTLTAAAPALTSANQPLVVANPPNALAFTTTAPDPVRGGTCLPATLEARRGGTPSPVVSTTTVGLTVAPTGSTRFFSDATCSTSTTSATLLAGATTTSFFVKPLTAGANVISAATAFGSAMQTINTTAIVRRGQCTFPPGTALADGGSTGTLSINCPVSPAVSDLSASFSMVQTTASITSTTEIGAAEVRCRLASVNTLTCTRRQGLEAADVQFQVAEVPQGMLVQRTTSTSCPAAITLATAVTPSRSFVLKETSSLTGTFDDEDMAVAQLTSSTTVSLSPTSCTGFDLQVVDWAGLTVVRGTLDGGLPLGAASVTVPGLPAASGDRALMLQPGTTFNGARSICSSLVRGAMPSASSVVFTRAVASTTCTLTPMENVHYERIDFGSRAVVREYTFLFGAGDASVPVTITPVDVSRTLVFSSNQAAGGQGMGESAHEGSAHFTEGLFSFVLTAANSVTVARGDSADPAQVTFYVAELVP